jgi:hypothetical protein
MKLASFILLAALCAAPLFAQEAKPLFNGTDLAGWTGNPKFWTIKGGVIVGQTTAENPTAHNTFLIWTNGAVSDFELSLEFKIIGGNSGVQYRSKVLDAGEWIVGGYQADFDAAHVWTGSLYEEKGRGVLTKRGLKTRIPEAEGKAKVEQLGVTTPAEEILASINKEGWNQLTIIVKGNHLRHILNGKLTVDVTDEQTSKSSSSGVIALQLHAGPPMKVESRNITLRN